MKRMVIGILAFVVGFGLLGGLVYFSSLPALEFNQLRNQVIVEIHYTGGLCADGDCSHTDTIKGNGIYSGGNSLSRDEVKKILSLLNESDLRKYPQTGGDEICPSAYDGQDISYVFPTKYDEDVFKICMIPDASNIDLFNYLGKILDEKTIR